MYRLHPKESAGRPNRTVGTGAVPFHPFPAHRRGALKEKGVVRRLIKHNVEVAQGSCTKQELVAPKLVVE